MKGLNIMLQPTFIAVVLAVVACICDLRTRRIPNALTFTAAAAAIVLQGMTGGAPGLVASVMGLLVGLAVFFPFFALGGLGAGDVKLLAALGAWLGAPTVLQVSFYSAIAGGVLGVIVALRAGYLRSALGNLAGFIRFWKTVGLKPVEGFTLESQDRPRLAYAVPMLAGLMVTLWMR